MPADAKTLIAVILCTLALAGTVVYSIHHPETGDDIYQAQVH